MCNFCYEARCFIASCSDSKHQTCYSALSLSRWSLWLLVWKTRKASLYSAASTDNDEYSYKYIVQEGVYTVSQRERCYFSEVQSKVQSKVHSPGFTPTLVCGTIKGYADRQYYSNYYPVRVCTAGLCVWLHRFVYVCIYMWPKKLAVWGLTTWKSIPMV